MTASHSKPPTKEQMAEYRAACGWEIACPDGKVRHRPYMNKGDAECDCRCPSGCDNGGCDTLYNTGCVELMAIHGKCPGGKHRVQVRKSGAA